MKKIPPILADKRLIVLGVVALTLLAGTMGPEVWERVMPEPARCEEYCEIQPLGAGKTSEIHLVFPGGDNDKEKRILIPDMQICTSMVEGLINPPKGRTAVKARCDVITFKPPPPPGEKTGRHASRHSK